MKKITLILGTLLVLLLTSCIGSDGRDGLDGLNGLDGENGKVIDIVGDFTAQDGYKIFFEFPQTIEVFETDVVLVYILFDQTEDSNGEVVDIWRLLPQTLILPQGLLQYNYEHTFFDVNIFLDADFDRGTLQAGDTDNQVFRIAVIPAETTGKSSVDKFNIDAVMRSLGVVEKDIQKIKLN
ncbi:FIG00653004: hypothetical protein [hydrothermal vent metagenome]|uniref:Collagen-like protein n=1 Tax=hydrothermal vent metagenome TaxID=652676 RepID=A0A3B0SX93_9ZZZZ